MNWGCYFEDEILFFINQGKISIEKYGNANVPLLNLWNPLSYFKDAVFTLVLRVGVVLSKLLSNLLNWHSAFWLFWKTFDKKYLAADAAIQSAKMKRKQLTSLKWALFEQLQSGSYGTLFRCKRIVRLWRLLKTSIWK